MTFEEWWNYDWHERNGYDNPVEKMEAMDSEAYQIMKKGYEGGYKQGWIDGKREGIRESDYFEGLEEGIKIGKLQP